jgi:ribosomal-protein-alanine N-acetyltransferase
MPLFNFTPFPVLKTKNLILRQISLDDDKEVFELRSNPETMKFIPRPLAENIEDAQKFVTECNDAIEKNELINWAITLKKDNKLIGMIGFFRMQPENFRAEVGYILNPNFHGKGIMKEALDEALKFGFEIMKLHSIEAVIDPKNVASEKLLRKAGFDKEAHFKENFFYDGAFLDTVIYSLLKSAKVVR